MGSLSTVTASYRAFVYHLFSGYYWMNLLAPCHQALHQFPCLAQQLVMKNKHPYIPDKIQANVMQTLYHSIQI